MPPTLSALTRSFMPNSTQGLLLAACLAELPRSRGAYAAWLADDAGDKFDHASVRLFPLLAIRARELGVAEPLLGRLQGEQRFAWLRNQGQARVASEAIAMLQAAGITSLLLKGTALANHYYRHPGLRTSADIDLLVRREQAEQALCLFRDRGWQAQEAWPSTPARFVLSHGFGMTSPEPHQTEIDLHWRLFRWADSPEAMADLWRKAIEVPLAGGLARYPGPADMLLHTCAHGAQWNEVAPIRWVADAAMIIRRHEVDWPHLLLQSERLGLTPHLQATLPYLAREFDLAVPPKVLETLAARKVSGREELIFAFCARPSDRRSLASLIRLHWQRYREMMAHSPRDLFEYLKLVVGSRKPRETLALLARTVRAGAGRRQG